MFYCVILTISWCEVRGGAAPQWELAIAPGPDQHNLELDKYFCQSVYFKEINFRLCLSVSENKLVAPLGESTSVEQVFSRVPGQRQKC